MTGWPRCSFVAQAAGDPLPGSAPPAEQWLLLEHPGPWGRHPPAGSGMPAAVVAGLAAWSDRSRGRVLLVRPPWAGRGQQRPEGLLRWFRVDSRPGREQVRAGWTAAGGDPLDAVRAEGEPWRDPVLVVCAHGRHDPCCAVRGRPVAAAAVAVAGPGLVWEGSHLGGCRFAPTAVLLPHGLVLGRVTPDRVPDLLAHYRAGLLPPADLLRGRSAFPPPVQAAQHHARAATGADRLDRLLPLGVEPLDAPGPGPVAAQALWRVRLTGPEPAGPGLVVDLAEQHSPAGRPLTCAASGPGILRRFDLLGLRTDAAAAGHPDGPAHQC